MTENVMEIAKNASCLMESPNVEQKRAILSLILSDCRLERNKLLYSLKKTVRFFIKNERLSVLAAQVKTNANTIIQEIINIAEMLTDADIALYRIPDCDSAQWHGKPENNIHDMI